MPNGKTFTIQRRKIREFIGVAPQSAEISVPMTATAVGGLGTKDMASVDRAVLVPPQAYETPGDQ
jgi:hypothetical protein